MEKQYPKKEFKPESDQKPDLNKCKGHPYDLKKAIERFEYGYLQNILLLNDWDLSQTAGMLGIDIEELKTKIDLYQLKPDV